MALHQLELFCSIKLLKQCIHFLLIDLYSALNFRRYTKFYGTSVDAATKLVHDALMGNHLSLGFDILLIHESSSF